LAGCSVLNQAPGNLETSAQRTSPSRAHYGGEQDVLATIAIVKHSGLPQQIGSHGVRLPVQELQPMTLFDYQLPHECGGLSFRVYEGGKTQILEYEYKEPNGAQVAIRDYVSGANPFVGPGLWSALDHTADSVSFMMADLALSRNQLLPEVSSRGLITGLPTLLKREFGLAYRSALHAAVMCGQRSPRLAAAAPPGVR
jgi:hypothetical protein